MHISFTDTVKQWEGDGGWYYVRLPKNTYDDLREIGTSHGRGFGAIKVAPTIGATTWETSIFPDSTDKSYLLFLKKSVRKAENLDIDSTVSCELEIGV